MRQLHKKMIFFALLTLCTALRWSKTGIPLKKAERKVAKAERRSEKLENSEGECTVTYTPEQISIAKEAGLDTSDWDTDADFTQRRTERGSNIFVSSWTNPDGFTADHLRIPYRFKTKNFPEWRMKLMTSWLDEMSGYIDGCIEF